ncbi:hypothetical protein K3495_g13998 [Podosphaera aphanis]|nr:hypothetical protein K3495_g13998 [Podosphaera aphanis]
MNKPGLIAIDDIHPYWYHNRFVEGAVPHETRHIILNPDLREIKTKGRPKDSKKHLVKKKG